MKKGNSEHHSIFDLKNPWEQHAHHVWLASSLTLARNLQKFKFPSKLDKAREQQIISLIVENLGDCPELTKPELFRSEEITPLQKEFLFEHFLVTDGFYQAHAGEGFVIDESGEFLAVLNVNDHLQLNMLDTQQEIEKAWNRLVKVEGHLGKTLDFA